MQCQAHAKRSGKQCTRAAIQGGRVCYVHGGAAPQTIAAARKRLDTQTALQWAEQELARVGMPERTPLEHLEHVLEEDARAFAVWDLACQSLVEEGSTLLGENRHGEQAIHPYVEERNKAAQRWARTSKYALDAGVSQRRVQIEQERANVIAGAVRAAFAALGLAADVQQRGLAVFAAQLRQLEPATIEG